MANNILDQLTKPLVKENPFIHMLFFGPMGGGKSYTSALCAIGNYKWRRGHQGESRPIIIVNTEESARWLVELFEREKIPVRVSPSRSPADLVKIMDAVRDGAAASLIVDSFTHHWYSFVNAYKEKYNVRFMSIEHWGKVIPEWRDLFSQRLATAPYDYFLCGRSGFTYEMEKDEETGKKAFTKTGVKVKLEGETGYEPDIVVYTERVEDLEDGKPIVTWDSTVIKSRAEMLSGKIFRKAKWENFAPAFFFLLDGAQPAKAIAETDARELLDRPDSGTEYIRRRKVALENIEGELTSIVPGQSREEKKWKVDALQAVFNTRSWTEIERLAPEILESGLSRLKRMAEQAKQNIANGVPIQEVLEETLKDLAGAV